MSAASAFISLSIVIPAYNEASRLPPNLRRVADYCESLDLPSSGLPNDPYEVIVVVERSTDQTLAASRAAAVGLAGVEVIDNQVQRGKGYAVRTGMLRARGAIVFFTDADLSTPIEEVERFLRYFAAHPEADVLIGNRRHPASRVRRPQGWLAAHLERGVQLVRTGARAAGRLERHAVRVQSLSAGGRAGNF